MHRIISINLDSFVGIITNSSSELFVLERQKSLEFVKEVITTLINSYNSIHESSYTYDTCFKEPEYCKYHFQYYKLPEDFRKKLERVYKIPKTMSALVDQVYQDGKIAFGANFYEWLKDKPWGTSLYEPEIVSGYLVLDDPIQFYNNSFQMIPIKIL